MFIVCVIVSLVFDLSPVLVLLSEFLSFTFILIPWASGFPALLCALISCQVFSAVVTFHFGSYVYCVLFLVLLSLLLILKSFQLLCTNVLHLCIGGFHILQ